MSDALIIKQLKNKDKTAIVALLDKYGAALYGTIYCQVNSEPIAKIVMEKTFLQIWQNANLFDQHKEQLFIWLLKIAYQSTYQVKKEQRFKPNIR